MERMSFGRWYTLLSFLVPFFFLFCCWPEFPRSAVICAGPVAITGFPLYYLFGRYRFNPAFILYPGHCLELTLETLVVLTCGVLYYLRRWPIPSAVSLVILLGHFILWAWVTGNHANPFVLRHTILPEYRMSTLGVAFRVCVMMIYFNGFPAIGFLSASAAALDLKLSSQQAGSAEVVAV